MLSTDVRSKKRAPAAIALGEERVEIDSLAGGSIGHPTRPRCAKTGTVRTRDERSREAFARRKRDADFVEQGDAGRRQTVAARLLARPRRALEKRNVRAVARERVRGDGAGGAGTDDGDFQAMTRAAA
jgi:hypothetical protein